MVHDSSARGEAPAEEGIKIGFEADGCVFGTWKNITFAVWGRGADLQLASEFSRLSAEVMARYERVSTAQVIVQGAAIPTPEARAEFDALALRSGAQMACAAVLLAGSGFWASAMRGFLTSLQLINRKRPFKAKSHTNVSELVDWLALEHTQITGVAITPELLRAQLRTLLDRPGVRTIVRLNHIT
jgi:hypothetical protein